MAENGRISQDLIKAPARRFRLPALDMDAVQRRRNIEFILGDLIDFIIAEVNAGTGGVQSILAAQGLLTNTAGNQIVAGQAGTIYPNYGTDAETVAEGNDSRIVNAVDRTGDLMTGYLGFDYADNLTATGTVQGDALLIAHQYNRFGTVAAGTGGRLPASVLKRPIFIRNDGAFQLLVYPNTGAAINGGSANAGVALYPGAIACFMARSATAWETFL